MKKQFDKWAEVRKLEPWRDNLSEFVRTQREMRGWTQETLADEAELSVSFISRLETGRTNPSYTALARVARALRVPIPVQP